MENRDREAIDSIYRSESRAVLAALIRLLGDFDLAEEALHGAFRAALEQWAQAGVPEKPRAWLVSAGRFKAIDSLRRLSRFDPLDANRHDRAVEDATLLASESVEDDRLRLIFTCCHPALAPDAQVALTLREVCGLTTDQIAHAYLTPATTLAQRIVRAKAADLSAEAIRLGRLLMRLLPEPEAIGLMALMLLLYRSWKPWHAQSWQTTVSPTRRARSCPGDWAEPTKRGLPTSELWRSPARKWNSASYSGGWRSCRPSDADR